MIKVIKNFLSNEEIIKLNNLAMHYYKTGIATQNGYFNRYSCRFAAKDFVYDPFIYDIQNRVTTSLGLGNLEVDLDRGVSGINMAINFAGSYIETHTDPKADNGAAVYRCNLLTQKSVIGGDLVFNGEIVNINPGDLHAYLASEFPHELTKVGGDVPRILWLFSYCAPQNTLEALSYE